MNMRISIIVQKYSKAFSFVFSFFLLFERSIKTNAEHNFIYYSTAVIIIIFIFILSAFSFSI